MVAVDWLVETYKYSVRKFWKIKVDIKVIMKINNI